MFKELFVGKKLIIFDLDGTTVKSEGVWNEAFKTVMKTLGVERGDTGITGATVKDRWVSIIAQTDIKNARPLDELVELTHNEFVKNLDKLILTEGFWPFVAELKLNKKLNLALVSNTSRVVVDRVTAHFELKEVFDFTICGNEVKKPKPDPEIYKKTLEHFKIRSKEALVFEDSLAGSISAAKAGIKVLLIWDGVTPKRKFPDEVLDYPMDFSPFPGNIDTTYYQDILDMAEEQKKVKE